MIKAIIFDCFGVLLGNAYKTRLAEVAQADPERAQEISAVNRASDMGILAQQEATERISELFGVSAEQFLREQTQVEIPNEELLEYIASLKARYPIGLLSNISSRERLERRFTAGQLDTHFDAVVASGDVGYVKPEPEIYELAAARLGVQPSECLMIDDIPEFCEGARAVGMHTVQFQTNQQAIAEISALIDRGGERD